VRIKSPSGDSRERAFDFTGPGSAICHATERTEVISVVSVDSVLSVAEKNDKENGKDAL
jgi:hypothetical protein|tara:strand:+ start:250 stop:426 length:177 start_codon:yes stop_codon:yes gene_type:complete